MAASSPLEATFGGDPERTFLIDRASAWTTGRILAFAADVTRRVPSLAGPAVAVRADSASFVVASMLGLWKSRRYPVLLDPEQMHEEATKGVVADAGCLLVTRHSEDPRSILIRERHDERLAPEYPTGRDPEVAFLTSGSGGAPKRVVKMAAQLADQFAVEPAWLGLPSAPVVVCLVPPHHILGYLYGLYVPAASRGRSVFLRGTPGAWIESVRARRPALVVAVPSQYRLMGMALEAALPSAVYLSSGAPLPRIVGTTFLQRAGTDIVQIYGSTETGGIAGRRGDAPWQAIPGLSWRLGDTGRLEVRSAWQEDPSGWVVTDDLAEASGEGFRLVGRVDSIVKVSGRRLSTEEVAREALDHPSVEECHAVAYDRDGETAVALFVTGRAGRASAARTSGRS